MPSGENAMLQTPRVWALSVLRTDPVSGSQSRIVPSLAPEARSLPSRENTILETEPVLSVLWAVPIIGSQSRTVVSPEREARSLPSGENAMPKT
jgi:hypothetical protein